MTPLRILYVEDNDDLRENIGMLLEADDREITSCASGEAALAAFEAGSFDVLVTDVSLPGLSGTDLARKILAKHPRQWIVMCSGYAFGQALNTLGPNVRSLSKPFMLEDMDKLLAEVSASVRG